MKTVGIATIHAINNFGSLLQAFATQTVVERLGYKTSIINYKYPNEYHFSEEISICGLQTEFSYAAKVGIICSHMYEEKRSEETNVISEGKKKTIDRNSTLSNYTVVA